MGSVGGVGGTPMRVRIGVPRSWKLSIGQSISVDGVCSTVVARGKGFFDVEYMPETLSKTTAGAFAPMRMVNLERSLTVRDFIDGHIVQGHVDAAIRVVGIEEQKGSRRVSVAIPAHLRKFVVPQGSVALNGVSLTIARVSGARATVALIPHTLTHTNLGFLKSGDMINIEVDLIARYIIGT